MTLHLEPVPGGFYDDIGRRGLHFDLDYLMDADAHSRHVAIESSYSLRADVLVVPEDVEVTE